MRRPYADPPAASTPRAGASVARSTLLHGKIREKNRIGARSVSQKALSIRYLRENSTLRAGSALHRHQIEKIGPDERAQRAANVSEWRATPARQQQCYSGR